VSQRGNEPLHVASLAGHLTVVRLLVENGADINSQSQVTASSRSFILSVFLYYPTERRREEKFFLLTT